MGRFLNSDLSDTLHSAYCHGTHAQYVYIQYVQKCKLIYVHVCQARTYQQLKNIIDLGHLESSTMLKMQNFLHPADCGWWSTSVILILDSWSTAKFMSALHIQCDNVLASIHKHTVHKRKSIRFRAAYYLLVSEWVSECRTKERVWHLFSFSQDQQTRSTPYKITTPVETGKSRKLNSFYRSPS